MSLLLQYLPGSLNESNIIEIFQQFGSMSLTMTKMKDPKFKYALITFSHTKDAAKAYHYQLGLWPRLSKMFCSSKNNYVKKRVHRINLQSAKKSTPSIQNLYNSNEDIN